MSDAGDILLEWHPLMIAGRIRDAIGERHQCDVAKDLGVSAAYLNDLLRACRGLSPRMAVQLAKIGVDGRLLYLKQEERRFEIERRYDTGELKRPRCLAQRAKR